MKTGRSELKNPVSTIKNAQKGKMIHQWFTRHFFIFIVLILFVCGDAEPNPVSKKRNFSEGIFTGETLHNPYLKERLEVQIHNKKVYMIFLHSSPDQTADKFGSFIINWEKLLANIFIRNPYFVFITRDFKTKSLNLSINDATIQNELC